MAALLVVALLSAGGVAVLVARTTADPVARAVDPAPSAPGTAGPDPASPATGRGGPSSDPAVVRREVAAMQGFVEGARGLRFLREVPVEVLAPADFKAAVLEAAREDDPNAAGETELLRAAGLVPARYDVTAGQRQLLGESVLGFYEPKKARLVVRGGAAFTPFLRHVLVHELTHALDDQHFHLDRPDLDKATDDRGWAFAALVEGSARRVEQAYVKQLPAADRASIDDENAAMAPDQQRTLADVPLVLAQLQMTPYDHGEPFVSALVAAGGTAALDAAMQEPPVTAEQVLHPAKFTGREAAQPVEAPPADGAVLLDGSLGELMTGMLLHGQDTNAVGALLWGGPQARADAHSRLGRGDLDLQRLLDGISGSGLGTVNTPDGWGGDHLVVWRPAGGGACFRADWRMDTPAALEGLAGQLQSWAAADGTATVSRPAPGLVRATRCAAP